MDAIDMAYSNLANAIIIQAVKDFRKNAKKYKKDNTNKEALKEMKAIIRFIKSPWYKTLTNVEPSVLLKKLREEVEYDG